MIVSRGWGILALLIPISMMLVFISLGNDKDNNMTLEQVLYALIVSGLILLMFGTLLKNKTTKKHDMYFISLPIWGIIWLIIGLVGLGYLYLKS